MKVLFAGTPHFAALHLSGLLDHGINIVGVITQPDKPGKRGKKPIPSEVKKLAQSKALPLIQANELTVADIEPFAADILVVVAYGQILKPPVLAKPLYGCINVHGSLLPRWRGAAPIQRAILAGDTETGVCIIQMDKGLDTGDILATRILAIKPKDSSQDLISALAKEGIDALVQVIEDISNNRSHATQQTDEGCCYAHKIDKSEARCDWQQSSKSISLAIRAFNPDPICFTYLGELRIKIYQASINQQQSQQGKPGEILDVSKKGILVACGTGSILLERIQLPLGKGSILSANDVLNARSELIFAGAKFV